MADLKPCPFCGEQPDWTAGMGWFAIECTGCHVETDAYAEAESASQVWNRRTAKDELVCGNCKGTGKQVGERCGRCEGTGHDKHDSWCVGGERDGVCNCGATPGVPACGNTPYDEGPFTIAAPSFAEAACRASCTVCWGENGEEWPCAAKAKRAAAGVAVGAGLQIDAAAIQDADSKRRAQGTDVEGKTTADSRCSGDDSKKAAAGVGRTEPQQEN